MDHWWTQQQMEKWPWPRSLLPQRISRAIQSALILRAFPWVDMPAWDIAWRYPGKFAAVVPICGGIIIPLDLLKHFPDLAKDAYPDDPGSYAQVAKKIGKTPVWIFHGGADDTVPVTNSRKINEALTGADGNVKYTEYPGVGHNSWDKAYAEPGLMPWLLSKSLP